MSAELPSRDANAAYLKSILKDTIPAKPPAPLDPRVAPTGASAGDALDAQPAVNSPAPDADVPDVIAARTRAGVTRSISGMAAKPAQPSVSDLAGGANRGVNRTPREL